jgi:DNA-binding FadR family transcriptional regulator
MINTVVQRQSLTDAIVAKLKEFILSGALKPGDRLPTEQELAERFGVSRLSIREAIRALRYLGILRSSQKKGLTVGRLDLQRFFPDQQILRARIAIETGILPIIIKRMAADKTIYDRLYALTARPNITTDPDVYVEADLAFHAELVAIADVAPLEIFTDLLRTFFMRFRRQVAGSKADMEEGVKLHRRIIAALRDGQLEKALTLVLKSFESYKIDW